MKTSQRMYIYLDEAGSIRASAAFVAGMFLTWQPGMWNAIYATQKEACKCGGDLHFHKIGRAPDDSRYLFASRMLSKLAQYKRTWYGRFIFVGQDQLEKWHSSLGSAQDVYDFILVDLIDRFGDKFPEPEAILTIAERNREKHDLYLPWGLRARLNEKSQSVGGPLYHVNMAPTWKEPLLQITDLLSSALRQQYLPSGNPNKIKLSKKLNTIADRLRVLEWRG